MIEDGLVRIQGRGVAGNPANRFEPIEYVPDPDAYDPDDPLPPTRLFRDTTKQILARNNSPDVGFNVSINPYRGCEHGCVYCYARPTHEYFGLSIGLDFETRIFVKQDAPKLLRQELMKRSWTPQVIAMSGVTDCYQPIERKLRITRGCLEVLAEFRNPVIMITKNHLVTRDVDILSEMASWNGVGVSISITTLKNELQRVMEPRTSIPARRLDAIEKLASSGVPVNVLVAPIVPGLTDEETPAILKAAADAGARGAGYVMLRLPFGVKTLVEDWLAINFPDRREKVLNRLRSMRDGQLYQSKWGTRQRGDGVFADQIEALFDTTCRKLGLNQDWRNRVLETGRFQRPEKQGPQLSLL